MARTKGGKVKKAKKGNLGKKLPRPFIKSPSRVIVKFHGTVELPGKGAVHKHLEPKAGPWSQLIKKFPKITIRRLFKTPQLKQVCNLVEDTKAKAKEIGCAYDPPNFRNTCVVQCPSGINSQKVAKELASWRTVKVAYVASKSTRPPLVNNPGQNPEFARAEMDFLRPAPVGIDAEYAWKIPGGDGGGKEGIALQFLDLEQGWTIDHEDLPRGIKRIYGANQDWEGHGTSVLSIVVGNDNTKGAIGIAPNVATIKVASIWQSDGEDINRYEALNAAINELTWGDVLLLEDQITARGNYPVNRGGYSATDGWGKYHKLPIEVDDTLFELIWTATTRGIVVVEAAGNGDIDLDRFEPSESTYWRHADSGAIMVAGATDADPHRVHTPSNFGSRINCYAWSQSIFCAGDGKRGTSQRAYSPPYFSGTSAAAAIIAGAALAFQGIAQANNLRPANHKGRLAPKELRQILSDPTTGTPSGDPPNDRIGVMPDLKSIIRKYVLGAP